VTEQASQKATATTSRGELGIPGLTPVSIAAVLFGLVTLTPALIYLSLAVGPLGGVERFVPVFVTILLFTEAGRITRRYITPQEAYIIYFMLQAFALWAVGGGIFGSWIQAYYYRYAPYTVLFGIADKLPTWYTPALNSWGPLHRTFLSSEWAMPLMIALISTACTTLIDYGISFVTSMVYIEVEKLDFPVAPIDVQAISTLTERTSEKVTYFSFAAMVALIYEFLLYGFPAVTEVFLGTRIALVDYPWYDLTALVEGVMPGAIFGVATDIANYLVGWLIPFNATVWVFIGSMAVWVVGNSLALRIDHPYFALWRAEWQPGVVNALGWWYQRATFDIWASVNVGVAVGVALYVFVNSFRPALRGVRSLTRLTPEQLRSSYVPLRLIIGMVVIGSLGGFALSAYLIPDLWFIWLVSWLVLPVLQGFLAARGIGETGLTVQIPYAREAFMLSFTAPGDPAPWVAPFYGASAAGIISHRVRVAQLLKARPLDYYKAYVILFPLILVISFIFYSIFWMMAPMPSSFYPWTAVQWPVGSLNFSLFISRAYQIFKPEVIVGSVAFVFLIAQGTKLIGFTFFSPIGFLAGITSLPPFALAYLIGALVGRYVEGRVGKEKWETRKSVIIAGAMCGEALAIATAMAITIIGKVVTSRPF